MDKFKEQAFSRKTGKAEWAALILYTIGIIVIGLFHEVWFDEAQAWQIARCASLKKILFEVPHYEGHPPLWHLILAIFAKNGAPYKFTLKALNTAISASAIGVLLFRSPFPKIIRCGLPFTYFLFYRYGVNTRPYCITMLAFFLAASFYKERNEHPWKYILSLTLLCLSSAYGILIAGGLCLVWTFEILSEIIKKKSCRSILKDKRVHSLVFILAVAIFLLLLIIPADDVYYDGVLEQQSFFERITDYRFINKLLFTPLDSWSTRFINAETIYVKVISIITIIITWPFIISITLKNKKTCTFLVPYLPTLLFFAYKYMAPHHLGISALFHIFTAWIIIADNGKIILPDYIGKIKAGISSPMIKRVISCFTVFVCIVPIYYSIAASYLDIINEYGNIRLGEFIKENHLEDSKIMLVWNYELQKEDDTENKKINKNAAEQASDTLDFATSALELPFEHKPIEQNMTYICGLGANLSVDFDRNIFMNFNVDCPDEMYLHYKYKEDSKAIMEQWRQQGLPDFILGPVPLDQVYSQEELEGVRYLPVFELPNVVINKDCVTDGFILIYMREDLFDDYPQLHWIYDPKANLYEIKK